MLLKPGAMTGIMCVLPLHEHTWLLSRTAVSLNAMHKTALLQSIHVGRFKLPGCLVSVLACLIEGALGKGPASCT